VESENLNWRKASKSGNGGAECVEIADHAGNVHLRDTTARERGMLTVDRVAFGALLASVKAGRLDLP
jgi:hypothetical protein